MEDNAQKKNKFQQFYSQLRTSFFNIMFELLKEKNTGIFFGCLIILIMFLQLIGLLFEPEKFAWKDEFFLSFVISICNYCRVIKAINEANSLFFYWALMFFGIGYLITMMALLIYMNYFLKNRKHYVETVVKLLRIMILLLYWVFYMPFFESFISILNCQNGVHYLDSNISCYSGIHIFYFVLCIIFLILLFVNNIITAMLYNETQPVQEDCLSRLESSFEVALVIYRSIVATFSNFCGSEVCSWVLISVYIISSSMLCYQYYKQIPYYNSFVSVFCGSLIFTYFWISINALLMKLVEVNGHIIIIFCGIPIITLLVKNLREKRIENLMKTNIDKLKLDIDSLIQVHNMTDFSKGIQKDQAQRMTMIGIVNLHIDECQNSECPCKEDFELYDVTSNQFSERNKSAPHQDEVFLNHFVKKLYEDALNKFINSPSIHIAFAFYLFKVMKNIHASLVELNIAIKKKPSLQQQFTIFRYKNIIEEYIIQDHQEHKNVYSELTNVIEFERLFGEMQKSIEKVCNLQVEFWTHLTTVVPDLNILNELGKKIYLAAEETDMYWNQLCKINPNYQLALNIYGEYLREIRNHEHLGNTYLERACNAVGGKKSIDDHAKTSDILFSSDTTVIHISGNKESIGKILKTSQGLQQVFGYTKTEVIGHSINILMPTLFAKKHTDFMERFFRTGRQVIFYVERNLFATHRNGHCFQMKIMVKQMPSLVEGIQYVGMVKPVASDYEYMLTDMDGIIDSFTKGLTGMLGLTPNLFKDKDSQINIQILAPELISFFLETQSKGRAAKSRFREQGGSNLTLIVPQNFHMIAKSESKQNPRGGSRTKGGRSQASNIRGRSTVFKQFLKMLSKPKKIQRDKMPTAQELMNQTEYKNCERRKEVQCEITCLDIKASTNDSLKMLVFKFSKNDKNEKKKMDDLAQYMADFQDQQRRMDNNYEEFKQVSVMDESQDNVDLPENRRNFSQQENQRPRQGESTRKVNFADDKSNSEESSENLSTPKQGTIKSGRSIQQNQDNQGSKQLSQQSSIKNSGQNTLHNQPPVSMKDLPGQSQFASQKFSVNNNSEIQVTPLGQNSGAVPNSQYDSQANLQKQPSTSQQSDGKMSKGVKNPFSSNQNEMNPIEEDVKDDIPDISMIETPRMDVSGIKLESAQKEKNSFLEELKKQSFIISDDSQQQVQNKKGRDISAFGEGPIKDKQSSEINNPQANMRSQQSSLLLEPERMVKKENVNNMQRQFIGDEVEPQEESIATESRRSQSQQQQQQQESDRSQSQEEESKRSQSQDESEEESYNKSSQSRSKSKSQSKSHKKSKTKSSGFDSQESDEEEGQEDGSQDKSGSEESDNQQRNQSSKKSSQKNDQMEFKPLLSGRQPYMNQFNNNGGGYPMPNQMMFGNNPQINNYMGGNNPNNLMPNMNDFRRQYDEDDNEPRSAASRGYSKRELQQLKFASEDIAALEEANRLAFKKMPIKKRDTHKIKTNMKYRCLDDGSEDENAASKSNINDDPQQLSSKEMHFRENILKFERRKRRKERKAREKEMKKIKALNDEQNSSVASSSVDEMGRGSTMGGEAADPDEEPSSSSSSSSSSEETKDLNNTRGRNNSAKNKKSDKKSNNNEDGEVSSVTTKQNKTERYHYILRLAIDEKYIPSSISNIGYAAYLIFAVLALLSNITLRTRTMVLMNSDMLNLDQGQFDSLLNVTIKELRSSAQSLKQAQADLSLQTATISEDQLAKINPDDVRMAFKKYPDMPDFYMFSIWEAIMEIVVGAFRISTTPITQITDENVTVFFVVKNCLNTVLQALKSSTDAILEESDISRKENMQIFLYLLITVSCALFFSLLFLIPVINRVTKSKQEVLKLFTLKNIEKHIDDQLKVCRNFISTKLQQSQDQENHDIDGEGDQMNMNDKELQNELNNNKYLKRIKKKNKGKKMKELSTNFGSTMLKFMLFLSIIEGYFLANYLLSFKFLTGVQDLTKELKLLISRQPVQSFLLLIEKELIYSNGTALIEGEQSLTYVPKYHERLYDEEEQLLDIFSQNYDSHSQSYNDDFNNIIYSNVCQYIEFDNKDTCEAFNQGILKKGIYSSVIKYWDFLRQLNHDFLESNRNATTIKQFLNDPRLQIAERMQDYYFKLSLQKLVSKLEEDIEYFFNVEYIQNRTIFIIYIIYIFILYFFIWRKFVSGMQNELWKTKTMLSVLPTKVCFEVKEIREVIQKNSSNDFLGTKL